MTAIQRSENFIKPIDDNTTPDSLPKELIQPERDVTSSYSALVPPFYNGSLEQPLQHSLFAYQTSRLLALYLQHDESSAMSTVCEGALCSEATIKYLLEHFIVWPWNRTSDVNYAQLLANVSKHLGEGVATIIDSLSINSYPLLVCLSFNQGQINVDTIIDGTVSDSEAFSQLLEICEKMNSQLEFPDTTGLPTSAVSIENWSMPASNLTHVSEQSEEFQRVARDFRIGEVGSSTIIRIDRIENLTWLVQYFNEKKIIDDRLGRTDTELLLFHGCPYLAAEQILQQGFDHRLIGKNGKEFEMN
ncbi:unnamed protein product [Rotaria sp. Silwood2]|nr:unnamed protein product [Rotaria sp. Silwood2]CAF4492979.1 unnamed protein product [Rotaria sp. Silwood2]CAF4562837.1 unnamed protein product [Rotaria sp. Silwood2]